MSEAFRAFEATAGHLTVSQLDTKISDTIERLENVGLNMGKWKNEYENLPSEASDLEVFLEKLVAFQHKRSDALSSFEFDAEVSSDEAAKIRQFDQEIMLAFKDHEHYLGMGATAEVYALRADDAICVKFITDQARYNENNHMRVEYERLATVYKHTRGFSKKIRVPHPIFLRIHAKEGHSYGMEKIHGENLSRILEVPEQYPELIAVAKQIDRDNLQAELQAFVIKMHEAGITHCDLYKRNIILDMSGRLCVIDFGKAKKIEFKGDLEDEQKSDIYNAQQTLRDFFAQIDKLTN